LFQQFYRQKLLPPIKKFFTFLLTLYIGQHKDHQAQLAAFNHLDA